MVFWVPTKNNIVGRANECHANGVKDTKEQTQCRTDVQAMPIFLRYPMAV
jgi:hypothetical protein